MSKDSIELSPKYGVNPSLLQCPVCHKDTGIALLGKLKGDAEAPKYMNELCDDCKKEYTVGIVVKSENNTTPTSIHLLIPKKNLQEKIRKYDYVYVPEEVYESIEQNNANKTT